MKRGLEALCTVVIEDIKIEYWDSPFGYSRDQIPPDPSIISFETVDSLNFGPRGIDLGVINAQIIVKRRRKVQFLCFWRWIIIEEVHTVTLCKTENKNGVMQYSGYHNGYYIETNDDI